MEKHSDENKMNVMNLGTIFGPHLLSPQTDDPQYLMECNAVSTNFVRAMLAQLSLFFPPASDEVAPRRLSVVFQPSNPPPWVKAPNSRENSVGVQRSLYQPKVHLMKYRDRQNTAPSSHKDPPSKARGGCGLWS